jgi:hypothetical protein
VDGENDGKREQHNLLQVRHPGLDAHLLDAADLSHVLQQLAFVYVHGSSGPDADAVWQHVWDEAADFERKVKEFSQKGGNCVKDSVAAGEDAVDGEGKGQFTDHLPRLVRRESHWRVVIAVFPAGNDAI